MTTTAVETPEKLVAEYQQTGSTLAFRAIYDYLQGYNELTYLTFRQILPESMLDSGELSAIVDDSLLQSLKSYNNAESSAGFLAYFLEIVRRTAEGIKRVRGVKVATVSEIYFYKVANSLPESAVQLWQKQWRMTVDDFLQFKAEVNAAVAIFSSYRESSNSLHKHWAKLLAWESTEFLGCSAYMPMDAQELQRARVSFRAYCQNKQRQDTAKQLRTLVAAYQKECSAQLFNAIYDHAAVVEVAEEYRCYMADPESYCTGQDAIHSDYAEMLLENALDAAVMEMPAGAELPAVYGKYIMAEFEHFIAMSERDTESTAS